MNEKDGQIYHNLIDTHLGYIPRPHLTEYNIKIVEALLRPIADSMISIKQLADLPNIDKMSGAGLDFIGTNFIGNLTRAVDPANYGNSYLIDTDYRIILKFAIIIKSTFPSIPNLRYAFNKLFGDGVVMIWERLLTIEYVIDTGSISSILINVLIEKQLIPKPAGINAIIIKRPPGKFFFNFPIGIDINGKAIYKPYEANTGLIYGEKYVVKI